MMGCRWDNPQARHTSRRTIVADADQLLEQIRALLADVLTDAPERVDLAEAAEQLSQTLLQDVDRRPEGVQTCTR